ncbi:MAG: GMC family oxidoreductase [Polyangiaceae bacterium]|nr:GMC family oxidoreductase [Polyangiaceae bacterium]
MIEADVIIVGSGPAGAAAAQQLVNAGTKVLMLEVGARPERDRFAAMKRAVLGEIPWEFPPYPYEMRGDDIELNEFALRILGGSSMSWGAITPRFHPNDFRMNQKYGVGVDWPISYSDLEKYYCDAEVFMGVSGADDNPYMGPRSQPFPMANFPLNDSDILVSKAASRLGIQMHSVPVARNSTPYDQRSACSYYSVCRACPIGAMFSSDRVVERLERRSNFRLRTNAEAIRVELDGNQRAKQIVFRDNDGQEHAAKADKFILATQTVETVRMLLNSACGKFPRGVGNNNGQLGLYFTEHPKFYVSGRVSQRLHPYKQGFETATTYKFHDHPMRHHYAGGRMMVRETGGPSVPEIAVQSGRWGQDLRDEIEEIFGHQIILGAFLEQLPRATNKISLSDTIRDSGGLPAACIDFQLVGEYEEAGFKAMKREMHKILDALGAQQVETAMPLSNSGHYMGGHRMGANPETSTTNSYLQTHEIDNLYLASGGAFPTSGVSNPTLTTVALTMRMSEHMLGAS